jgi:hypothetical protein
MKHLLKLQQKIVIVIVIIITNTELLSVANESIHQKCRCGETHFSTDERDFRIKLLNLEFILNGRYVRHLLMYCTVKTSLKH